MEVVSLGSQNGLIREIKMNGSGLIREVKMVSLGRLK